MNKQTTTAARRFITCTQSRGGIGKSTFAEGLISWLNFSSIPYAAIDADLQNRTLSNRYPGDVHLFDATRTKADFLRLMMELPDSPVLLVDFPAQSTNILLEYAEHYGLCDFFEKKGIRPTIVIFAADDPEAKLSGSDTVKFFLDRADYVLVENLAKFESDVFKTTPLFRWLVQHGTPTVSLPAIASPTIGAWEALERKEGAYLSLDEASTHPAIHELTRYELQCFRDRMLTQLEDIADRLLPDISLIKNRVTPFGPKRQKSDRLTDAWL
jgi:hypothetical protein